MIAVHARGDSIIGIGNLARSYELVKYLAVRTRVVGLFECEEKLRSRYESKNVRFFDTTEAVLGALRQYKEPLYISDLVNPPQSLSTQIRRCGVRCIIHFNEIDRGFEPDVLIVTNDFSFPQQPKNFKVIGGFDFYIVGEEVRKNRLGQPKQPLSLQNILVCFGGADPGSCTEKFVEAIKPDSKRYTVIVGPAMSSVRKKSLYEHSSDNLRFIDSPASLHRLILEHDCLVTLGGMTTYEAMCLGVPVCAVQWEYLADNVKRFSDLGMVSDLGHSETAYSALQSLSVDEVNRRCWNAFSKIDGRALENVASALSHQLTFKIPS